MGYNLTIGEYEVDSCPEERYAHAGAAACLIDVKDAPLNSSDNHSNTCWPSYTAWHEFAKSVGLYSLFYAPRREEDERISSISEWWLDDKGEEHEGLLRRHPGAAALTPAHLRAFEAAIPKSLIMDSAL